MTGYYMGVPSPTAIISSLSVFLVLDVAAVVLRFGARIKSRQPIQADDWLTIPGLVSGLIGYKCSMLITRKMLVTGLATVLFYGVNTKSLGYPIDSLRNPTRGIPTRKVHDPYPAPLMCF